MFNSIMWKYIEEETEVLSSIAKNEEMEQIIPQFSEIDAYISLPMAALIMQHIVQLHLFLSLLMFVYIHVRLQNLFMEHKLIIMRMWNVPLFWESLKQERAVV